MIDASCQAWVDALEREDVRLAGGRLVDYFEIVPISQQMIDDAKDNHARIRATFTDPERGNYTGLSMPDNFADGYVGEDVFRAWLERHGKRFKYERIPDGRSHRAEFTLWAKGKPFRCDVKASSKWTHRYFMNPVVQPIDARLFVGVRLDLPEMRGAVMGAIAARDYKALPVKTFPPKNIPTRFIEYDDLPVRVPELLAKLDKSEGKA